MDFKHSIPASHKEENIYKSESKIPVKAFDGESLVAEDFNKAKLKQAWYQKA